MSWMDPLATTLLLLSVAVRVPAWDVRLLARRAVN
jgi:hypothetical protein